jgi:hypothetical protein
VVVEDLIVKFGPLDSSKLGLCTRGRGTPTITINEASWKALDEEEKEILLFHEMGHCILELTHNNAQAGDRKWASLMLQWPQRISDYGSRKEGYLKELFQGSE